MYYTILESKDYDPKRRKLLKDFCNIADSLGMIARTQGNVYTGESVKEVRDMFKEEYDRTFKSEVYIPYTNFNNKNGEDLINIGTEYFEELNSVAEQIFISKYKRANMKKVMKRLTGNPKNIILTSIYVLLGQKLYSQEASKVVICECLDNESDALIKELAFNMNIKFLNLANHSDYMELKKYTLTYK